jgi:hypothetical protein
MIRPRCRQQAAAHHHRPGNHQRCDAGQNPPPPPWGQISGAVDSNESAGHRLRHSLHGKLPGRPRHDQRPVLVVHVNYGTYPEVAHDSAGALSAGQLADRYLATTPLMAVSVPGYARQLGTCMG